MELILPHEEELLHWETVGTVLQCDIPETPGEFEPSSHIDTERGGCERWCGSQRRLRWAPTQDHFCKKELNTPHAMEAIEPYSIWKSLGTKIRFTASAASQNCDVLIHLS